MDPHCSIALKETSLLKALRQCAALLNSGIYSSGIIRYIEDLGFIEIKINTLASVVNPNSKSVIKAFNSERKYSVPAMLHRSSDPLLQEQ